MKKVVLYVEVQDEKNKRKAMRMVSSLFGIDSITMDLKAKKMTLTGDIDPVSIVSKLRKNYYTEITSVEQVKEPEKKKDEPKKDEPKKVDPKAQAQAQALAQAQAQAQAYFQSYYSHQAYNSMPYYVKSVEEDPNACVIC